MLYLALSICFTSIIYLIFRAIGKKGGDSLAIIIINYLVSALIGAFFILPEFRENIEVLSPNFLAIGGLMGILFLGEFMLMNRSTQLLGVAGGTVISRMSLVIPTTVSIILLNEKIGALRLIGIVLALISIYFTVFTKKDKASENKPFHKKAIFIPIITFLGAGLVDTSLKLTDTYLLEGKSETIFIELLYIFAFLAGVLAFFFLKHDKNQIFLKKNIKWGIFLGIANYFSLWLFMLALTKFDIDGSKIFPINSVGIVSISTIASIFIFKEKLNSRKYIGLFLALLSIVLINLN